ncbi:AbfB domain-containing protein [Cryptosporangium sp. NPDC048952]|uniref:AbfB domain-containing protein n=1 Tax=Cryptosporangium sp. NPDC048952 TaxID=3363961 RepID=UPI00371804ED
MTEKVSTALPSTAMVRAAQDGDVQAVRTLVSDNLPLLYTLVVRAAGPSVDVEDVLVRTVLLVGAGMPGLVEPDHFRPWLLGTALRFLWTAEQAGNQVGPCGADWPVVVPIDPSDQREEANNAVRWLAPDDRELLSVWWLEASGELSRDEVVAACGLTPAVAGNRLRQIEARFEDARTAIRVLGASPPCPQLTALLQHWDRRPSDRQRRQIARHATDCPTCSGRAGDLIPADRLLRGTPLVAPPASVRESLLARCERGPDPDGESGAPAIVEAVRRTAANPWVGTTARIVAVTVAVILLIVSLATYANSRKSRPVPTGSRNLPSASPAALPSRPGELRGSYSLRSVANPDRFVQIVNEMAFVLPVTRTSPAAMKQSATFELVNGLGDASCRSFRVASGQYLRHFRFRVQVDPDDRTAIFRKDTTFCPRPGATKDSVSFQSINYPDQYLHLRGDELWIDKSDGTAGFLTTASFTVVQAWA